MTALAKRTRAVVWCGVVWVALGGVLSACGATSKSVRKADAALLVECAVPTARVYLDDTFVGRASELAGRAIPVRSGTSRVEIRADGYFSAYRDVPVAPGARERLAVELRPVPPGEPGG